MSIMEIKSGYKTFNVDIDLQKLKLEAEDYKQEFFNYADRVALHTDTLVSEEEFVADIDKLINYLDELKKNPELIKEHLVDKIGKKKDGWLYKGRVLHAYICNKTAWVSEEEYGYRCYCLKVKALDAYHLKVFLIEDIFQW